MQRHWWWWWWLLLSLCAGCCYALRIMVICGEHAREHVTRRMCERLNCELLYDNHSVRVIADANPAGAAIARHIDPCWRGNAAGVDLNRNWPHVCSDSEHEHSLQPSALRPSEALLQNPGAAPFSEHETRVLLHELESFRPHIVFAVHSGTEALLLPYHCSSGRLLRNYSAQVRLLRWLRTAAGEYFHSVWIGSAGRDLYGAQGTLCDYAVDRLGVLMCVTVEMYGPRNATSCEATFGVAVDNARMTSTQRDAEQRWSRDFFANSIRLLQQHDTEVLNLLTNGY